MLIFVAFFTKHLQITRVYFRILLKIHVRPNENCNFWVSVCICEARKTFTCLQYSAASSLLHSCSKITASGWLDGGLHQGPSRVSGWGSPGLKLWTNNKASGCLFPRWALYSLILFLVSRTYFWMGEIKTLSINMVPCSWNNDVCLILVQPSHASPTFLLLFPPSLSSFVTSVFLTIFLQATAIGKKIIVFSCCLPSIFFFYWFS